MGNFVVKPNHTHGILLINKSGNDLTDTTVTDANVKTPNLGVSTTTGETKIGGKNEKWKPNTIGSIINQYKRILTINARKIHANFAWQSRFHDHIIRNAKSFENIQNYITNNPFNWGKDKFHESITKHTRLILKERSIAQLPKFGSNCIVINRKKDLSLSLKG